MITFTPGTWAHVKPYDTVTFKVGTRLRRLVVTANPHPRQDGELSVFVTGYYVNKDGSRSRAFRSRYDAYVDIHIDQIVNVSRFEHQVEREIAAVLDEAHAENAARTPAAPVPSKPLTPAMQRAVKILEADGYVDTIDGVTVGTIVALMNRGILREATPLHHGLGAGRNYPATTPEQVWEDAYDMHMDECDRIARERDEREAAELEADGGWGQPDGMLGATGSMVVNVASVNAKLAAVGRGPIDKAAILAKAPIDSLLHSGTPEARPQRIEVGSVVVRCGEEGPDAPRGIVTQIEEGWAHAYVAFSGLVPCRIRLSMLRLAPKQDQCCESVESGGITTHEDGCPRFWPLTAEEAAYRHHVANVTPSAPAETPVDLPAEESWKHPYAEQNGRCGTCGFGPESNRHPATERPIDLLRRLVRQSGGTVREISDALTALDEIAAQAPQRATGRHSELLWRHGCGWVGEGETGGTPPYLCLGANCWADLPWQPVYTIGGGQ